MAKKNQNYFQNYIDAGDEFIDSDKPLYEQGDDVFYEELSPEELTKLNRSSYENINTDPALKNAELDALRSLEQRKNEGLSLQDEADLERMRSGVNRRNRGRMGAIQQNMQSRGISSSGLDLVSQMQASQDAAEMEALASLEKSAQVQNNKRAAAIDAGNMAGNIRNQNFSEEARKAEARDSINRFNTANMVNRQNSNNDLRNRATDQNWERKNRVSDQNVDARYQHQKDNLTTKQNTAQMGYNKEVDDWNRQDMLNQRRKAEKAAKWGAITGAAGAGVGAVYGGPAGAGAGYSAGSSMGQAFASDERLKKNLKDEGEDEIEVFLANLNPKSYQYKGEGKQRHGVVAQDLAKSNIGLDLLRSDEEGKLHVDVNDAVGALLQAVALLNRKVNK